MSQLQSEQKSTCQRVVEFISSSPFLFLIAALFKAKACEWQINLSASDLNLKQRSSQHWAVASKRSEGPSLQNRGAAPACWIRIARSLLIRCIWSFASLFVCLFELDLELELELELEFRVLALQNCRVLFGGRI